jgi:ATP-binding cassette subfamily C protein LapB
LSDHDSNSGDTQRNAPSGQAGGASDSTGATDNSSGDQETDIWPLQAGRSAVHIPQIECLRILAGYYGRRASNAGLVAGLPLTGNHLPPYLFSRAAERADLEAKLVRRSLDALAIAPSLPCLLVLEQEQACILRDVERRESGDKFVVQFPETEAETQEISHDALARIYTGYAYFVRPVARIDERAGPSPIDTTRDWFWGTLKQNKKIYTEVIIAAVLINLFALASPLFIMNVYDRVIPNSAYSTLWVLVVGVVTVFTFDFVIKNLRAWMLDYAGRRADVKISAQLFEQILGMQMAARPASAGVLANHMREFETIRDFFTSATMAALIDLPFALLFIAIIAVIAGPVALVPTLAVPIIILGAYILQRPLNRIIKESMHENALKNAHLFETITGLETIKTQAAEGHTQRDWEELTDKAARTSVKSRQITALAQNFATFIQQLTTVGIVAYGVYLIGDAQISMGALIAAVILNGRAMAPLAQVASLMTRFNQSVESYRQLEELMRKPVERPADKHFIPMPNIQGRIDFRDVVFHYPDQSMPALDDVSFTIQPGTHIGIIGAVGSGKTTIERLLLNLYQPDSGSVQLDGTDVRQIDPGDLRRSIGSVQQDAKLFYGSVRENITMGHETAPDSSVVRAAEQAGVMAFLRESQAGLDTPVGERGEALSGGQRQAVAIARALLYDPPVLVLDEPTANIDPGSENRLRKRLARIVENKTTILITHKGSMLPLVDTLILMDKGKLVAHGPKDEVISKLQARQYGTQTEQTNA